MYLSSGSCLAPNELQSLAQHYNERYGRQNDDVIDHTAPQEVLLQQLSERLRAPPHQWRDTAADWLGRDHRQVLDAAFRPRMPAQWKRNPYQWLSTDDIEAVMSQYQDLHPDFKFLGVFPIDFDKKVFMNRCIADEMCRLSVSDLLSEGKTHFGAVLNLDEHDQRGSHWVSVYGNCDPANVNYGLHYYDSVGRAPPNEVTIFMDRMAGQLRELVLAGRLQELMGGASKTRAITTKTTATHRGKPDEVPITHNAVRQQYKNTECGIFAMYFLVCCMSKKLPVNQVWRAMGRDDTIHNLRYVFYSA
jgi:hypothetical protein